MATSTFTLPVDVLSNLPNVERRASFSAAQKSTGVERAASPRLHYRHDQEAVEMSTLGDNLDPKLVSTVGIPEVSAWTMNLKKEWAAIITCCGCMFMNGWNDATTGPLLPIIQSHYGIGFIVVSMLFVSNCVGYLSAALVNIHLSDRLGFGKVTLLGSVLQILAYAVLAPTPPFPVMCISYAINGFGIGLQNAQANGFVTGIPNNTSAKLGLLHAGYEIMGVPAPHGDNASISRTDENAYKMVFGSRAVQLLAFFTWVYVGAEVTVGGWIVTFIIEERGGGASAGINARSCAAVMGKQEGECIGERRVVYLYSVLAIGLELVIWLVPDIIGNALAVSFIGILLGPMYPIVMKVTSGLVPKRILTGCIGWIASSGQVGSAVFPFMTGALAQKYGVKVLQPMLVGMIGSLILLWTLVPAGPQRHRD
ncbi:hypothetical protein RhiTH_002239 [Rhizoctonia solani]